MIGSVVTGLTGSIRGRQEQSIITCKNKRRNHRRLTSKNQERGSQTEVRVVHVKGNAEKDGVTAKVNLQGRRKKIKRPKRSEEAGRASDSGDASRRIR